MSENETTAFETAPPAPQPPTMADLERREAELVEARQAAEARIRELQERLDQVRAAELAIVDERAAYARRLAAGDDDAGGAADFDERGRVEALRREGLEALLAEARAHLEELVTGAQEIAVPLGRLRTAREVERFSVEALAELDVMRRRYRDLAAAFGRFLTTVNAMVCYDRSAASHVFEQMFAYQPQWPELVPIFHGNPGTPRMDPLLGPLEADNWQLVIPAFGAANLRLNVPPMVPPAPAEQATP